MSTNRTVSDTGHRPQVKPKRPELGYLALTAALYRNDDAVCAEILEFDVASEGSDFDDAYAKIIEAVETSLAGSDGSPNDTLDRFVRDFGLTVYPQPPSTYRPAAIPRHLLSKQGLILRPVSISIEAALHS
jgi:hypothetical protein